MLRYIINNHFLLPFQLNVLISIDNNKEKHRGQGNKESRFCFGKEPVTNSDDKDIQCDSFCKIVLNTVINSKRETVNAFYKAIHKSKHSSGYSTKKFGGDRDKRG